MWTTPAGARPSGSSMTIAKLFVPSGAPDQASGGEIFSPTQFAFGAGFQDKELHPLRPSRLLRVLDCELSNRIVRVLQEGDHLGPGNQLGNHLDPLGGQIEAADAGKVAAWPGETGY